MDLEKSIWAPCHWLSFLSSILICLPVSSDGAAPGGHVVVFPVQDVLQDRHGIPHVGEARIQGGETEAHDGRLAVVADDTAPDQGLHDGKAVRMGEADLAAAPGRLAR